MNEEKYQNKLANMSDTELKYEKLRMENRVMKLSFGRKLLNYFKASFIATAGGFLTGLGVFGIGKAVSKPSHRNAETVEFRKDVAQDFKGMQKFGANIYVDAVERPGLAKASVGLAFLTITATTVLGTIGLNKKTRKNDKQKLTFVEMEEKRRAASSVSKESGAETGMVM
jgi:hypothetical protein